MRTQGAYEYGEDQEEMILKLISHEPQTTNSITKKAKPLFSKIHGLTVKRLLNNLYSRGKVKKSLVGKITLWTI